MRPRRTTPGVAADCGPRDPAARDCRPAAGDYAPTAHSAARNRPERRRSRARAAAWCATSLKDRC
eukprot:14872450-Alexandrium_andersonii.AAC.1